MSLHYLVRHKFNTQDYITNNWDPDWYIKVRTMPLAEMFSQTPQELAVELIDLSITPEWKEMQRRPIQCGDIFFFGDTPYVYMPTNEQVTEQHVTYNILPGRQDYCIVMLSDNTKDKDECNIPTNQTNIT